LTVFVPVKVPCALAHTDQLSRSNFTGFLNRDFRASPDTRQSPTSRGALCSIQADPQKRRSFSLREARMSRRLRSIALGIGAALIGSVIGIAYDVGAPMVSYEDVAHARSYPVSALLPADWLATRANNPAFAVSCSIKGNVSASGERINHVPGQRYYDKTLVQLLKGERWLCSEDEAREAGWRKAKV
jgi:hypothetical protein